MFEDSEPRRLILASGSPRRLELLRALGVAFDIVPARVVEDPEPAPGETPEGLAMRLAWQKCMAVAERYPEALVLAADTVVALDRSVLGKPRDAADAEAMLASLRGRSHEVITGLFVACVATGLQVGTADHTIVHFRDYTDAEAEAYIASGDPMDKAGAYGIQHPGFRPAVRVEGCYYNVVGLPLCVAASLLLRGGLDIMVQPGFSVPAACRVAECRLLS
jgi:MAF protein